MNIYLRHIGSFGGSPAKIIELVVENDTVKMIETVTNSNGLVSNDLIKNLIDIADCLSLQNDLIAQGN